MPPEFTLRPATQADCDAVRALVFSVLADYALQVDPETTDADLFDLEGHYAKRGGCFDVVTNTEGRVIGSVGLQPQEPGICELRKMYLHPHYRGLGIGKTLLQHALSRATALGFSEVRLETAAVLKEAVRMYEKAGFQRYEPEHCAARCDAAYRLRL
ncbi:MAG TPA: N-acetyltransferase [Verrucomicrobiales bacterium]|nr:N-acetyltransferase [Verrucomicrobiales bacterium]